MNSSLKIALSIGLVVTLLAIGMVSTSSEDSDAATYEVNVYLEDGSSKQAISGDTVRSIMTKAFGSNLAMNSNSVTSYNGVSNSSSKVWMLYQYVNVSSGVGWDVVRCDGSSDKDIMNGTSYILHYATITTESTPEGPKTRYSVPEFRPISTAYFYISFVEDVNAPSVSHILTESERKTGFWMSGTGSDVADAFADACGKYAFELRMNLGGIGESVDASGHSLKGWLGSFLGLENEEFSNGDYKYWVQYRWDGSRYIYNDWCLGHYDPGVYKYFEITRNTTSVDGGGSTLAVKPPTSGNPTVLDPSRVDFSKTKITLDRTSLAMNEGESTKITETITSDYPNNSVVWSTSSSRVARVVDGTITAVGGGTATITASANGGAAIAICQVTVTAALLSLNENSLKLALGSQYQLTASKQGATWTSSNESVAKVSRLGMVTTIGIGNVEITATLSGNTAKCIIGVVGSLTFSLSDRSVPLNVNGTWKLSGTQGYSITLWSSSDTSVATVDNSGLVKGIKAGTVTIFAKTSTGEEARCTVTVTGGGGGNQNTEVEYEMSVEVDADSSVPKELIEEFVDRSNKLLENNASVNSTLIIDGKGSDSISLPYVEALKGSSVSVNIPNGKVSISKEVIESVYTGDMSISVKEGDTSGLSDAQKSKVANADLILNLSMTVAGRSVHQLGGDVVISIAYSSGLNVDGIEVWYINDDGKAERVSNVSHSNGILKFTVNHFSVFMVGQPASEDSPDGFDWTTYVIVAVVVIAIVAVIAVVLLRRP